MIATTDLYELARQNRDPRFDGRFFVGVLTTGIYCRPVCPVRIPKRENVILYPTAAAAAEAGFRPCLRCRPETAPGEPAWLGSSHTVSKALQLISQGELTRESPAALAAELGIGPRQLGRLFRKHLGASPKTVMQTRRLHFAKQLLDETDLPLADVGFAAGFGSVRRFNDVIKTTYGVPPGRLRRHRGRRQAEGEGVRLRLTYRPPFDWRSMLEFFARRAIPGVESVSGRSYRRSFSLGEETGLLCLEFMPSGNTAWLQVSFPDSSRLLDIVERTRQLFDLQADSDWIDNWLSGDPQLKPIIAGNRGLRVPGCWQGLEIAIRAIVGQQVSVTAATTLLGRLVERTGTRFQTADEQTGGTLYRVFPGAARLADADLSGLGITTRRIQAIRSLARAVHDGEVQFNGNVAAAELGKRLCEIDGIGEWTAQYIAMRALRDPDAFPHGDLILRRALVAGDKPLSPGQLLARAEAWRPWRAYAVMLLWRHYQQSTQSRAPG